MLCRGDDNRPSSHKGKARQGARKLEWKGNAYSLFAGVGCLTEVVEGHRCGIRPDPCVFATVINRFGMGTAPRGGKQRPGWVGRALE